VAGFATIREVLSVAAVLLGIFCSVLTIYGVLTARRHKVQERLALERERGFIDGLNIILKTCDKQGALLLEMAEFVKKIDPEGKFHNGRFERAKEQAEIVRDDRSEMLRTQIASIFGER
jgi:hypothetical protein